MCCNKQNICFLKVSIKACFEDTKKGKKKNATYRIQECRPKDVTKVRTVNFVVMKIDMRQCSTSAAAAIM